MSLPLCVGSLRAEPVENRGQSEHSVGADEVSHHGAFGRCAVVRGEVVRQGQNAAERLGDLKQVTSTGQSLWVDERRRHIDGAVARSRGREFRRTAGQHILELRRALGLQVGAVVDPELLVRLRRMSDLSVATNGFEDSLRLLGVAVGPRHGHSDDVERQQLAQVAAELRDLVQFGRCDTHGGHQPPEVVEPQASHRLLAGDPVFDRVDVRVGEAGHLLGLEVGAAEEGDSLLL